MNIIIYCAWPYHGGREFFPYPSSTLRNEQLVTTIVESSRTVMRVFTCCALRSGASLHHRWSGLVAAGGPGRLIGAVPDALQYSVPQPILFARRRTLKSKNVNIVVLT